MSKRSKTADRTKVALITGGAHRLGRHIALHLAREGFDIAIVYHSVSPAKVLREIRAIGRQCIAIRTDMKSVRDIRRAVKTAVGRFKNIDLLVNNAGMFVDVSWENIDEKLWDRVLATNVKGPTFLMMEVGKVMKASGRGTIINIDSLGGLQPWRRHIPYNVSKAGLIMSTRCFARVLAPEIRVNAIAPGTIIVEGEENPDTGHVPVKTIPLQRYGKSDDIAELVVFLAVHGNYITGQVIAVDGGRTIVPIGD